MEGGCVGCGVEVVEAEKLRRSGGAEHRIRTGDAIPRARTSNLTPRRSRLGCQVHVTKDLDGMTVKLPSATRNMYVDGE